MITSKYDIVHLPSLSEMPDIYLPLKLACGISLHAHSRSSIIILAIVIKDEVTKGMTQGGCL